MVGRLDSRIDQDWFVTKADATGRLRVVLDLESSSRWLNTFAVQITDAAGEVVAEAASGADLILEVKATAGEVFQIGLMSAGLLHDASPYRLKAMMLQSEPPSPPVSDGVIVGSARAEQLIGTAGNDLFDGRGGDDTLLGGEGVDVTIFNAALEDLTVLSVDGPGWSCLWRLRGQRDPSDGHRNPPCERRRSPADAPWYRPLAA
jgi:hypothetical protein